MTDGKIVADPSSGGDVLANATAPLSTVRLDDLNEAAELQERTDRKYVLELDQIDDMLNDLGGGFRVLELDNRRSFGYATVYFDTPEFDLYRLAATRRRHRYKVRIRRYVDAGAAMLEVKTKGVRGRTVKHRFPHDAADRDRLTPSARSLVRDVVPDDVLVDDLEPVLRTTFARTTLLDVASASRITIDADLTCTDLTEFDTGRTGRAVTFDHLLLETKSMGTASPIDRWLWGHGVRPSRISKYSTALAILHPELPRNRWHQTIARHF